ncbi:MAG: efflux RND transporter periplasmic adaptor subunit [Vicinamibacterales bacterium]
MKKLILTIIVLACIGGGAAAYYMNRSAPEPTVSTLQLTRGDVIDSVGATGTLGAVETVDVGTQVSGTVQDLYADFNDIVRKGQVIARLDPSLLQTNIEQQRANVTRAEADLDRLRVNLADAKRKFEQAKQMWDKQLIPRDQYETAELNVKTQEAQIRSSEAGLVQSKSQLNTAEVNLGHTVIRAPIDGIVISRSVDQGQTVAASMNAPTLYVLAQDLSKMQVLANIDESEIGKMRPGQPVTFRVDAYPTDIFHGEVVQVRLQPATVQNVVTYATVISVPNPDLKLKPGMTANVTIEIARRNNVLRAPNAALRFRPTNDIFAALKQEVPAEMNRGSGGRNGQNAGGNRGAGFNGASGQPGQPAGTPQGAPTNPPTARGAQRQAASAAAAPSTVPATPSAERRRDPSAQGGGDRPQGERAQGGASAGSPQGEGRGGNFANMTPEEREARRKEREERMKNMTPEEREAMMARMRNGGGRGGGGRDGAPAAAGRGNAPAGAAGAQRSERAGISPQGGARRTPATGGTPSSPLMATRATTIDTLFAPIAIPEGRGRVWLYINKQLKLVNVRTGISDGTWTEIIETPEVTQQLKESTEVVTSVVTGLEQQNRPGQQGAGSNPLMGPQRGNQRGGGPGGAPGGGGRGR